MSGYRFALVSQVDAASTADLERTAAALQKQIDRDYIPLWKPKATINITVFSSLEKVPPSHWPIILRADIGTPGAMALHQERDGVPFALVTFTDQWTHSASHQMLEMAANPRSNWTVSSKSVRPGDRHKVRYLVQVCDPCQNLTFAYSIEGVLVSDFYTPHYFDEAAKPDVRYSFTGAIKRPRQVLSGGYLSWYDPKTRHWWQKQYFSHRQPRFVDLGIFDTGMDAPDANSVEGKEPTSPSAPAATVTQPLEEVKELMDSKAVHWHRRIDVLFEKFGTGK